MPARHSVNQIGFCCRSVDCTIGVMHGNVMHSTSYLGDDETRKVYRAVHKMAVRVSIQYSADNSPVKTTQGHPIKLWIQRGTRPLMTSSRFDMEMS